MKRADLTEKILDIKREKGWSWKHICSQIGGYSEVLIVGALLGQMKLTRPQCAKAGELFGLSQAEAAMLNEVPMRGQGDGHRPGWYGAPNGTMTNGAVEPTGTVATTTGAGGEPSFVVKYKEGEKRIVVPANAHIVRYEVGSRSDLKAGEQFAILAAAKQPDGTFTAARINVGKDGGRPF